MRDPHVGEGDDVNQVTAPMVQFGDFSFVELDPDVLS